MPKGQLKRAKRLKKGPKNPFLNLKNKKSVFRRVVKRLNTEKSKKITERGKGKNHGRLRLFAQPQTRHKTPGITPAPGAGTHTQTATHIAAAVAVNPRL